MSTKSIAHLSLYRRWTVSSLLARSLADRRLMTILIGVGTGLMSFGVAVMYPALADTLAEFDLGEAFDNLFGSSGLGTPEGWLSTEMYSIWIPGSIIALVIVDGGRSIAGEQEDLSIGLLAANPISRVRLIIIKTAAMWVHMLVASALISAGTWAGVVVVDLDMAQSSVWFAAVHVVAFGTMIVGFTALIAAVLGKRKPTMLVVGAVAFIAYMAAALLPISPDLADWAQSSPWYYYWSSDPLVNGIDWTHVAVMTAIGITLFVASVATFNRKDLRG